MRRSLLLLSTLMALACGGGGDAAAPSDPFPNAAGIYNITGGFDGVPTSQGSLTGTLTLSQASRQSGTLGGNVSITATLNGEVGVITFTVSQGGSESWTFTGTRTSSGISGGRHTLTDGRQQISGSWQGSLTSSP